MAELPSPPASLIPLDEASIYGSADGGSGGLGPLHPDAPIVQCEHCDKPVLASALSEHHSMSVFHSMCDPLELTTD